MLSIVAQKRENIGKKLNTLRKNKIIPAVVYGKEVNSLPIEINYNDFKELFKKAGESTIIKLKIKDKEKEKEYPVLIREVQKHPISEEVLHIDFYQVPMNEEIEVTVPLEFEGVAPAEKEKGGIIVKNIHELEIKALPQNLIHSIKVDLSLLKEIDQEIKVKDLKVPEGVKILADKEEVVVVAIPPKEEKIEEVEQKPEEVEVVKEKKKEEEEEGEKEKEE